MPDRIAAEILRRARAVIEDPQRWCQGAVARDGDGLGVPSLSPAALQFCGLGALERVCGGYGTEEYRLARPYLSMACGYERGPTDVNDDEGHGAVLDLFDQAVALAEAEG